MRCNLNFETKLNEEVKNNKVGPAKLILDRLSPSAFNAIAEDEEVKRRLDEIMVADMQDRARRAALDGDWNRVNALLNESKGLAGSNEWLSHSLGELQKFAMERKTEHFSKEAMYSADKMRRRLSSSDEIHASYEVSDELDKRAYLRRKISRGKRMSR